MVDKTSVGKKYITQERRENDRRSYNIVLTREGRAFLNRVKDFGNEIMDLIEKALTEEEIHTFSMMCKRITEMVSSGYLYYHTSILP